MFKYYFSDEYSSAVSEKLILFRHKILFFYKKLWDLESSYSWIYEVVIRKGDKIKKSLLWLIFTLVLIFLIIYISVGFNRILRQSTKGHRWKFNDLI